jgi:hypothetical protein
LGFSAREIPALLEDLFYRIAGSDEDWSAKAYSYNEPWKILIPSAMWFQDLYIFDLSTMWDSTTPVATQEGEISFSAYNSARWRKVVEHLHQTATLPQWHQRYDRHKIYAKGKRVDLSEVSDASNRLVHIDS